MKAAVTGASGFIGQTLSAHLTATGWDVVPVRRDASGGLPEGWLQSAPDVIFHLAGRTQAPDAAEFYRANTLLTAQLLDAVAASPNRPLVILAGSAAEYGKVAPDCVPVSESHPCLPQSDYGISKYAQTLMAGLRASANLRIVVARIWNPVGANMPRHLALGSFATQIASLPSEGGILRVGNLAVERDFIDVAEVARIMAALATHPGAIGQVVNVCSGRAFRLRDLVQSMIRLAGRPIAIEVDGRRVRPDETMRLFGDPGRLHGLGLVPKPPDFEVLLPELLAAVTAQARSKA